MTKTMSKRLPPDPGQESVWDYPRPPHLESTLRLIEIHFAGVVIARSQRAYRTLETSHPPTYYLPPEDILMQYLRPTNRSSVCEWKGNATYFTVAVGEQSAIDAAWSYPRPHTGFEPIARHLAFYAGKMDACFVDGERVVPQPGAFYGGWITSEIVGPFKGEPGSSGW